MTTSPIWIRPHAATGSSSPPKQPLSHEQVIEKIRRITDRQIGFIGLEITATIMARVGPIGKAVAMVTIAEQKKNLLSVPEMQELGLVFMRADKAIVEGKTGFFSDEDVGKIFSYALPQIKEQIKKSFSLPDKFFAFGTSFKLSEYTAVGLLRETAEKIGTKITLNDVLKRYHVQLKLDEKTTKERSELVFELAEQSDGIEFTNNKFTLDDLEQKHAEVIKMLLKEIFASSSKL